MEDLSGPLELEGSLVTAPCLDGTERRYLDLDAAASTPPLARVARAVADFLPLYSSVHRGSGYKSLVSSSAYELARDAVHAFAGRGEDDVVVLVRNTTEAINHLAYRLRLEKDDVVATTMLEHHANLLPWGRVATRRVVDCEPDGTLALASLVAALEAAPRPKLLAITGASNVTGWMPPIAEVIAAAHARGVPVVLDAAQLAPHRPLPPDADYVVFSGHKLYAPFGTGALIGPRATFEQGDPFLVGGGAVDLVDLDEVVWSAPPEREEAGSPNVIGAVALHAAIAAYREVGFDAIGAHDAGLAALLRAGLAAIPGVRLLGPAPAVDTLPVASFVVEGLPHGLVAARLSAEFAIGVRHGCFCAHPYLVRLLGLSGPALERFRRSARAGRRDELPGAVRASAGLGTTEDDIARFLDAVTRIASEPAPARYRLDARSATWWPDGFPLPGEDLGASPGCGPG